MSRVSDFIREHDFPCWCGERAASLVCKQFFGRRRFAVLRCNACGTHRILPRALHDQTAAEKLYNTYENPGVVAQEESAFIQKMLRRFNDVDLQIPARTRVLDVGCGNGCLLDGICRTFDCTGKGIDVDQRRIQTALSRNGPAQFECGLFDAAKVDSQYDAVISSAVIEHVIDPVGFLKQLAGGLRPGGSLFLLTPNASSLNYRWLGSWWRELLSIGEHIYLFTPKSLTACADKAGFRLVNASSDFDWGRLRLNFSSAKSAAVSLWATYCYMVKGLSSAVASSKTGDILYANFRKP
jgi:2-polyprenyl-3-methyl-5-hydroxy-6-metoxy-1,4-benzoquinol methylase